jgi:tRNA(fMet)-specific endonuclease VapC
MAAALFMIDTNIASCAISGRSIQLRRKLLDTPLDRQCFSVITQAELLFGVARKPGALKLAGLVDEFLLRVRILPWSSDAALAYAELRANLERRGVSLGNMDMPIAAHAKAEGAVLVSNDQALRRLEPFVAVEDWTAAP